MLALTQVGNEQPLIIGQAAAAQEMLARARRVAPTPSTVLLTGETGTGKEILARFIHGASKHKNGPFVPVTLTAQPSELIESLLFGHEKGAFTGASRQQLGQFELANHGTIFLDEIGDLDRHSQAKLLRAIQEREILRVGAPRAMKLDIRIIAATNKDLERCVELGTFREDLFHRLNVQHIALPPLRERTDDIATLASHFLSRTASKFGVEPKKLSRSALAALKKYRWPGNIRELGNVVECLMTYVEGRTIGANDLPAKLTASSLAHGSPAPQRHADAMREFDRRLVQDALGRARGNKKKAAAILGLSYSTFRDKHRRHGL